MSQAEATAPAKSTLDPKIPWIFFITITSQMLVTTIAGSYLAFYMTENMLISALVMGGVMMGTRIVDLIIGVACGAIVQKVCFKHGQFRTWLLYAPITVAIGTTMCFINPNVPVGVKAAMVFIGYIGYGGGMSFAQISQNGMMAKIAGPNMQNRLSISAKIVQGQNFGRILASFITLPLITLFNNMGTDGYTVVQIMFAVVGVLGQMTLFVSTKKYESYDPNFKAGNSAASVGIFTMFANTLKNGQIIILFIADICRYTVMMSLASLVSYYFKYAVGDLQMMTPYMLTTSVLALVGAFAGRAIAGKIGKKNSALATAVICMIGYTCVALFAQSNAVLFIVFTAFAGFGAMIIGSCGATLYLDCAEYQLYKTGKDNRTFAMSLFGVAIKLGFVFTSIIVSGLLEVSGYDATAPGVAAGITGVIANVPLFVRLLGFIFAGIYAIYFILMCLYQITEAKSKEYAEHNHKAAQERAAASAN